jgi:hypothetical protein
LLALDLGLAVGVALEPWVPGLYAHAEYRYTLSERVETSDPMTEDFNLDRSDYSLQVGYGFLRRFEVNVVLEGRKAHGGFDFVDWNEVSETVHENHDQLLREDIVLLGGGLSYEITDKFSVGAAARFFVAGRNTRDTNLFGINMEYQVY